MVTLGGTLYIHCKIEKKKPRHEDIMDSRWFIQSDLKIMYCVRHFICGYKLCQLQCVNEIYIVR